MSATTAIIKKEFRSYFTSPLAYIVLGIFSALMGVIFLVFVNYYYGAMNQMMMTGRQGLNIDHYVTQFFAQASFVMCFLSPMFTIRLFAEEKRQNTFELLLTAPITSWGLVFGKFFSAMVLVSSLILINTVFMAFLVGWGNPDLGMMGATYLGLFLLMGLFVSFGCLVSAVSSSQVMAFILNYFSLLVLFLMSAFGQVINWNVVGIDVGAVLTYLSPLEHQRSFTKGLLQANDFFYFISGTLLCLFLTHRVVEGNRWR